MAVGNEFMIETRGLTRFFGGLKAVDEVCLQVPRGSIYGFLGPNGAGKTTTIRMLLGLAHPHGGGVCLFGLPFAGHRRQILRRTGTLVESPSLYPHLSGWENLEILRRLTGAKRSQIQRVLAITHLEDAARRPVKEYSLGMRQRLGLAMALFGEPQLLILDEPTNGLDPAGIHEMRELICSLPGVGITVFLSSHMLSEVEHMATHIGIIDCGKLIFQGTADELRVHYLENAILVTERLEDARQFLLSQGWQAVHLDNQHLAIAVNGLCDVAMINAQLVNAGYQVYHLALSHPTLEDIFLTLTDSMAVGGNS